MRDVRATHRASAVLFGGVVLAACGSGVATNASQRSATVRIVIVGDVMLGRGVATVAAREPDTVFEHLRPVLVAADVAVGNLESPLTDRAHVGGEHALEASPSAAELLAGAGFDVMSVANNHASDAGPGTVDDTRAALDAAGVASVGGGDERWQPLVIEHDGVRVAFLAVDTTRTDESGAVAAWDESRVRAAVDDARSRADVVVVGLHGGVEYLPRPDPVLRRDVASVASWGADVVWASGAHVSYPVELVDGSRPTIRAPGLGNALFDQRAASTTAGAVLEVLARADGVVAYRVGRVESELRARFVGWDDPTGDAVALDGDWWTLARGVEVVPDVEVHRVPELFADAAVTAARRGGDVTGDGVPDTVVAYWRPPRPRVLHAAFPDVRFGDDAGRTAHLALFDGVDGRLRWGAGTMLAPAATLAVCDGAVGLGLATVADADTVVAAAAWTWRGDGFSTSAALAAHSPPECADVDGDGTTEPVVLAGRGDHRSGG